MAILAGGNRHYFLSEIMAVTAKRAEEIIAAQRYFSNQAADLAGKRLGPERDIWRDAFIARRDYATALNIEERAIYYADNKAQDAAIQDQLDRERATRERKHLQSFTKTAATFVAAGFAAPLFFGPATGGLYASGSAASGAAAAGGAGSLALNAVKKEDPNYRRALIAALLSGAAGGAIGGAAQNYKAGKESDRLKRQYAATGGYNKGSQPGLSPQNN